MNDIILSFNGNSYSLFNSSEFIVENIENLTWGQNELSTATNPFIAGDTVQNNVGAARDITITLKPTEDMGDYCDLQHKLARGLGKACTLKWKNRVIPSLITNAPALTSDLIINGIINEYESGRFEESVRITLNIHCSDPYWQTVDAQTITLTGGTAITVCNYSEVETGFKLVVPNFNLNEQAYEDFYVLAFAMHGGEQYNTEMLILNQYWGPLVGTGNLYLSFEKGKVSIKYGATEDTATDVSRKLKWKMAGSSKLVYWKNNEEILKFPFVPFNYGAHSMTLESFFAAASGSTVTAKEATLSYYPKFL